MGDMAEAAREEEDLGVPTGVAEFGKIFDFSFPPAMPWLIVEVPDTQRRLEHIVGPLGYQVAVFGSTIKNGQGHDLDVMIVNMTGPTFGAHQVASALAGHLIESSRNMLQLPHRSVLSCSYVDERGRTLDVKILE